MALVLVVALAIAMPVVFSLQGLPACMSAMIAAVIVWVASTLALVICQILSHAGQALASLVLGMIVRMSLPLAACIIVHVNRGAMSDTGFAVLVLYFYLVALPLDTLLAVTDAHSTKAA